MRFSIGTVIFWMALTVSPLLSAAEQRWSQASFLDFIQGTLSDGGANTYVAADGSVRLINQWDLNGDGFVDLVFPSSHDNNLGVDSFIYWGGKNGFITNRMTRLPGDGTAGLAVADLNHDGFPDVVLANEFNGTKTELHSFIYWGNEGGYSAKNRTDLPTTAATSVAVADLNGDGYPDLVFASSGSSYQFSKAGGDYTFLRPASDIYWGSAQGYSSNRVSQLLTYNAHDVKIVDLNGDGHPDILFAEQGIAGHVGGVRIYSGNAHGDYSKRRMQFLPGASTTAVTTADLNHDGYPEILLANQGSGVSEAGAASGNYPFSSYIYWGSAAGYQPKRRTELPTAGARDVKVADLNGDGLPDIVYANRSGGASWIYWGTFGTGGYSPMRRTALPTSHASRCAIADLNGDGRPDLVFSNENDDGKNEVSSVVYWNSPEGFLPSRKTELPTLGAMAVSADDLNRDGWPDLVFANARDGTAGQPVDTYLYWGNRNGAYSASARQTIKGQGLMSYNAADLDADGYVDLVLVGKELRVLRGSHEGFSPTNSFTLPVHYAFNARVADFNRDGYLDLSVSDWAGSADKDGIFIFWGGPSGFSADNRCGLLCSGIRTHTLADFNNDGYVDILATSTDGQAVIFWNGPSGFTPAHKTLLPTRMCVAAEVADLNADGYLDIIFCNLFASDKLARSSKPVPVSAPAQTATFESGTYIYWGGPKGYSVKNRLDLPTVGAEDASVADFNRDGYLDLVISSYHAGDRRNHPSYVFWGSAQGLSKDRVTLLPTESASGVLSADFNQDGWPDILFACHTDGTNHRCESFLYWGGPDGFSTTRRNDVPSVGTHFLSVADIGNIANRSDNFDYISPPFDAGAEAHFKSIAWDGSTPGKSAIKFQVRFGSSPKALKNSSWIGPEGKGSSFTQTGGELPQGSRWFQYKAILISPNGAAAPILKSVTLK
jgi:hypothetical protein